MTLAERPQRASVPALRMARESIFGGAPLRTPDPPLPVERRTGTEYATPPASGLRVTWLGHSTMLLEIDDRHQAERDMWKALGCLG